MDLSQEIKVPQSILEQVIDEMFLNLEKGNQFDAETLEELRKLAKTVSLIDENKLTTIIKMQRGSSEDTRAGNK